MLILDPVNIKKKIDARVSADVACGKVGGAAVLVKQCGNTIYSGFFGEDGNGREINEKTVFRLASMTKPITAVAILKQIERGLISLDDTIDRFIPEYSDMDIGAFGADKSVVVVEKSRVKITVKHLLSHTSGVGSGKLSGELDKLTADAQTDLKSVTDAYAHLPLSFEPYTDQAYSATIGFDILARIVEITSGKSFDEYLSDEIFIPLGMTDTTFAPSNDQWSRTVRMHTYKDGVASFKPQNTTSIFGGYPLTYKCGGAGLVSTLADYEKFTDMLVSGGKTPSGGRILFEETVKLMATPAEPFGISPSQKWGLSVRVITNDSNRIPKGSFGWSGAYGCHFWVDPTNSITAIYMKNSTFDGGSGAQTAANFEMDVYLK